MLSHFSGSLGVPDFILPEVEFADKFAGDFLELTCGVDLTKIPRPVVTRLIWSRINETGYREEMVDSTVRKL